ncbi:mavicyanin-like protein [Carex littledalei]|uniref:Mavicyanin-like protein n=1 Tax=Carex littledalei TaxID=544730 RepID=A0A833QMK9_9POAL|nr:mavicyanin-like protein [Carex littledalei]
MASFLKSFMALMAMAALADMAMCANYTVGAPTGMWDLSTNYEEWVKAIKFYPGDFLTFSYSSFHDVAEVNKATYTTCSSSETLTIDKSGTTVIELKAVGTRYFICAVPTHCSSGMKIKIDVLTKTKTPVPAPSSPPKLSPLAPKHSPKSAPVFPPVGSKAAVAQNGAGVFVYSVMALIGLMFAVL